jgi:hypothetical protein
METEDAGVILHQHVLETREEVIRLALNAKPGTFIFVVGLPGSGKTLMIPFIMRALAGSPSQWMKGTLPVIRVVLARAENGFYSAKDTMIRLYKALTTPDMSWLGIGREKTDIEIQMEDDLDNISKAWEAIKEPATEPKLRRSFEKYAPSRGVKYVFVDEGNALCSTKANIRPFRHIRSYMQLAADSETVWIVFGTQEMAELWQAYGEARRRGKFCYLKRYSEVEPKDFIPLVGIHKKLSRNYKFSNKKLIEKRFGQIHSSTAGIFAEIELFYERADRNRLASGRDAISDEDILNAVYCEADFERLWGDVKAFDALLVPKNVSVMSDMLRKIWSNLKKGANDEDKEDPLT